MFKRSKILSCHQQPTILTRKRKADETVIEAVEHQSRKRPNSDRHDEQSPPSDFVTYGRDSAVDRLVDEDEDDEEDQEEDSESSGVNDEKWPFVESKLTSSRRWFHHVTRQSTRNNSSPMPFVRWAEGEHVWDIMVDKDNFCQQQKDHRYLEKHYGLQPRMRAIVLDWLIEVCEVYRLQRDTYLLAMDFFDRYFTRTNNIEKQYLQLVGITCLFLASKYEEIYPPKLNEFAYVTDGACTNDEILEQEIVLLKVLDWDASTLTVTDWLHTFLQLNGKRSSIASSDVADTDSSLLIPNYSAHFFYQITQLVDLCMLDISCLRFAHRTIAASALYHMSSLQTLQTATGFEWDDVRHCISWMTPFVTTILENGLCDMKFFNEVQDDESHNIQVHLFDLALYDKAVEKQNVIFSMTLAASPVLIHAGVLTPPNSNEKAVGDFIDDD